MIVLSPRYSFHVPVDAKTISPNSFIHKTLSEIKSLPIWEGNRQRILDDLFKVNYKNEKLSEDATIRIVGDVTKLKKIGAKMSLGQIVVEGSVGMRLGEEMRDGVITVKGNAGSWVGTMMKGGRIEVMGTVGDYVGAAYRGSTEGMGGGTIIIRGNAGSEVGCFMRNGLIKVHGNIGSFVGMHMRDGTIFIEGDSDGRLGSGMLRGKIIVLGLVSSILPTFNVNSIKKRVKVGNKRVSGPFYMFTGDLAGNGEGRLYVSQTRNPHLRVYEKYLIS